MVLKRLQEVNEYMCDYESSPTVVLAGLCVYICVSTSVCLSVCVCLCMHLHPPQGYYYLLFTEIKSFQVSLCVYACVILFITSCCRKQPKLACPSVQSPTQFARKTTHYRIMCLTSSPLTSILTHAILYFEVTIL